MFLGSRELSPSTKTQHRKSNADKQNENTIEHQFSLSASNTLQNLLTENTSPPRLPLPLSSSAPTYLLRLDQTTEPLSRHPKPHQSWRKGHLSLMKMFIDRCKFPKRKKKQKKITFVFGENSFGNFGHIQAPDSPGVFGRDVVRKDRSLDAGRLGLGYAWLSHQQAKSRNKK
jgi:hypothetical protein